MGTLKGIREPEKYIVYATHYCSWHKGATDNAVAYSLMLEMARIFSKYREQLGRGIKFAWWTGHSHGTFAGSTWYLDNFWDDIRDKAIAYLTDGRQ
ncbi:M28 family metallopeptidase [Thermodesulfobacteriota bacterium]